MITAEERKKIQAICDRFQAEVKAGKYKSSFDLKLSDRKAHVDKTKEINKQLAELIDAKIIKVRGSEQVIKCLTLASLVPRQRMAIPLSGHTPIKGTIRIILKDNYIEIHYTADIKSKNPADQRDDVNEVSHPGATLTSNRGP